MESLTEPQSASTGNQVLAAIRRGFLVWSWIGLLGAYTSTSAVYGSQLIRLVADGVDRFKFASYWSVTVASLMLPIIVLTVGWLLFGQYSRAIFAIALLPEAESASKGRIDSDRLAFLFNSSIFYLMFSWVAILFTLLLPYVVMLFL